MHVNFDASANTSRYCDVIDYVFTEDRRDWVTSCLTIYCVVINCSLGQSALDFEVYFGPELWITWSINILKSGTITLLDVRG